MMEDTKENQCTVKRRDALRYIGAGALGTGLTGVTSLSGKASAKESGRKYNGDKVEIAITKSRGRPKEWKTVSREWIEAQDRAREVAGRLKKELLPKSGIASVGIRPMEESIGKLRKPSVYVGLSDNNVDAHIPERSNNIPIRVDKNIGKVEFQDCYDWEVNPLKGGLKIVTEENNGASLGCRVEKNNVKYMLTARHPFLQSDCGCEPGNVNGVRAEQPPGSGEVIGDVEDYGYEHDYALLSLDYRNASNEMMDETGTMDGYISEDGISWYTSSFSNESLEFRGYKSCDLSGIEVTAYDEYRDCSENIPCDDSNIILTELVHFTANTQGGDSGGVYYKDNGSSLDMVALHIGNDGTAFGSAGYALHNLNGINFDT